MTTAPDRRARKRLSTRTLLSDTATRLFSERGFDHVTVDEIAAAADVGRKTVFNHFPRKEDLFFDRTGEIGDIVLQAVRQRGAGTSPIEALRLLAHRLVAEDSPYLDFSDLSRRWVRTLVASETLQGRARAIRDETAALLRGALAETAGQAPADASAALAAALTVAIWTVALAQAHRAFQSHGNAAEAQRTFLALIDQGTIGVKAALTGTAYI